MRGPPKPSPQRSLFMIREMFPGLCLVAALVLLVPGSARGSPIPMTAGQYRLYRSYVTTVASPAVRKLPAARRLAAVARTLRVRESSLREAVKAGDVVGPTIADASRKELRTELEGTILQGRVTDIDVDASTSHVVTYVEWRNIDGERLDGEATTVALVAARAVPITSTIAIWARDPAGQKIFEAKIGAEVALHFQQERIEMFAHTRYIHMFEDVRRGAISENGRPAP